MTMDTIDRKQPSAGYDKVPPLAHGERLTQPEFHRRYLETSDGVKAELVEGIVYMASPVGSLHGESQSIFVGLLVAYQAATPGTRSADNATLILGTGSEPQPDLHLRILSSHGGRVNAQNGVLTGAPELVIEVSDSTRSLDLNAKRRDYDKAGVLEYLVLLVQEVGLRAFGTGGTEYPTGPDGIYRSRVFPGLWIDPAAVVACDARRALRILRQGLKSPEHKAFLQQLKGRKVKRVKQ